MEPFLNVQIKLAKLLNIDLAKELEYYKSQLDKKTIFQIGKHTSFLNKVIFTADEDFYREYFKNYFKLANNFKSDAFQLNALWSIKESEKTSTMPLGFVEIEL